MLHIITLNRKAKQNLHDCLLALAPNDQVIIIPSPSTVEISEYFDALQEISSALGEKPKLLLSPELTSTQVNFFEGVADAVDMASFVALTEKQKTVSWF